MNPPVIHQPNASFLFSDIQLTKPMNEGNNCVIKYIVKDNKSPFYIQTPKCFIKSKIQKGGSKKFTCDLLFPSMNEEFTSWIENLEKYSQDYLFENREKWFETSLEMEDIEDFFSSSFKVVKSGKYYSLHTQVPTENGQCNLFIYNQQHNTVPIEDVKEMTPVITILEVVGVKCVSRGFYILWEMKQMMVMEEKEAVTFRNCLISTTESSPPPSEPLRDDSFSVVCEENSLEVMDPPPPPSEHSLDNVLTTPQKEDVHPPPPKTNIDLELEEVDIMINEDKGQFELVNTSLLQTRNKYTKLLYEMFEKIKEKKNELQIMCIEAKSVMEKYLPDEKIPEKYSFSLTFPFPIKDV